MRVSSFGVWGGKEGERDPSPLSLPTPGAPGDLACRLLDCKTVGFFLKISKEIGKAWGKSLTRAKRASLPEAREKSVSPQSRSVFSSSFHTFCLTARAYLNTQKYGLFCSLAGYLIRLAVNSFFAARELQQITLSIASLPLNCFVNLAPLGLYFCLIFSLVPKTIHRETQLKLVQQTNTRNWRTCVWSRKSKWFVILELHDYVTRKKLRVKKERYWLTRERNDCNLGQKVLRILHFLTHRMPIPRIWYRYDPSPRPTLVKIV